MSRLTKIIVTTLCIVSLGGSIYPATALHLDTVTLAKGYQITSDDGFLTVTVQPQKVNLAVDVSVRKLSDSELASLPVPANFIVPMGGYVFDTSFTSGQLNKPLILTLDSALGAPFFYDKTRDIWRELPYTRVNKATRVETTLTYAQIIVAQRQSWVAPSNLNSNDIPTSAAVLEDENGQIIVSKNSSRQMSLASLTKLMTAIVVSDLNPKLTGTVTMQKKDDTPPAKIPCRVGDKLTVKSLWQAMLVGSRNNAARALARSTGLSDEQFVQKMNNTASAMGLMSTHFVDMTGLDEKNVSTPEDVARLLRVAMARDVVAQTMNLKKVSMSFKSRKGVYTIATTNKLLGKQDGIIAGKTGYIEESGYNFAVVSQSGGHKYIAVVMGAPDDKTRFEVAGQLLQLATSSSQIAAK